uniref:Uncharacterized protein n=1 Tax=Sorghum bicolor TaxID=4558 RepID=Q9XEQ4_SORBI|nr:hypothetical protein [Sorghum bicolor]
MLKESELMQMVHNPSSLQNPKSIHYRWMSKVGMKQLLRLLLADTYQWQPTKWGHSTEAKDRQTRNARTARNRRQSNNLGAAQQAPGNKIKIPPSTPIASPPSTGAESRSEIRGELEEERRKDEEKRGTADSPARKKGKGRRVYGNLERSRREGRRKNICGVDRSAKERKIPACRAARLGWTRETGRRAEQQPAGAYRVRDPVRSGAVAVVVVVVVAPTPMPTASEREGKETDGSCVDSVAL